MFQSILARLSARAGARWAMIVGNDGILLEADNRAFRTQAEGLAAEYAGLMRMSWKAAADTDMGPMQSSLLVTDQAKILFQTLTDDYFLVVCLELDAHAGKAFYEISRAVAPIAEELVF
jgi:predicted regulator of Ras-like GTPase activity (Roadblock/LC7/MglB family)